MISNQVLFQIIPSRFFIQHGFEPRDEDSFVEAHFFNKNKTNTTEIHEKFKGGNLNTEFFYFEDPKNNHNYIREIGSDFAKIEKMAMETIEIIYKADLNELSLEVNGK